MLYLELDRGFGTFLYLICSLKSSDRDLMKAAVLSVFGEDA